MRWNYNNPLKDRVLEMLRNVDSIFFFFFLLWGGHDGGGHGKEEEGPFQSWDLSRLHRESGPRNVSSPMVDPKGSSVFCRHIQACLFSVLSLSLLLFLPPSFSLLPSLPPSLAFLLFLPLWSALFVKSRTVPRLTLRSINHLELFSKCFRFEKTQTTLGQPLFLFLLHC